MEFTRLCSRKRYRYRQHRARKSWKLILSAAEQKLQFRASLWFSTRYYSARGVKMTREIDSTVIGAKGWDFDGKFSTNQPVLAGKLRCVISFVRFLRSHSTRLWKVLRLGKFLRHVYYGIRTYDTISVIYFTNSIITNAHFFEYLDKIVFIFALKKKNGIYIRYIRGNRDDCSIYKYSDG